MENIEEIIDKTKIKYMEPMEKHTTMRVGGPADILVKPTEIDEIISVLSYAKSNNIPVTVIGNGSKLVVTDKGIRGIVIKLGNNFSSYDVDGEYITAKSGTFIPKLAIVARDESLSGLEFASGIPGVVGGSVRMNAGAYDGEIANCLVETTYIDENLDVKTIDNTSHKFAYRYSIFRENPKWIILSAKFKLTKGNKEDISNKMKINNDSRRAKQPIEYPSAGSVFKRPVGHYVGQMIQELGLKGYTIGGATVSEKHAGFIVNKGNAKAKDIIELIEYIRKKVLEKYSVNLESEIEIVGER